MSERKRISHYLAYRSADETQHVVIWDTIDIRVGRRKTQDIVIPDVEVSREHARFWRENEHHLVEDLNTAVGTFVNGEQIKQHALEPGDVVRIGAFEFTYGRTDQPLRPDANTHYASELKSRFAAPAAAGAGRTMLGIELGDSAVLSAPTEVPPQLASARAVSADGTLEEVESDDPLGLSFGPDDLIGPELVRDLDLELSAPPEAAEETPLELSDLRSDALGPSAEPSSGARPPRLTMVLEIEAATSEIAALVTALYGKDIGHPLLRIRIKKPDEQ